MMTTFCATGETELGSYCGRTCVQPNKPCTLEAWRVCSTTTSMRKSGIHGRQIQASGLCQDKPRRSIQQDLLGRWQSPSAAEQPKSCSFDSGPYTSQPCSPWLKTTSRAGKHYPPTQSQDSRWYQPGYVFSGVIRLVHLQHIITWHPPSWSSRILHHRPGHSRRRWTSKQTQHSRNR